MAIRFDTAGDRVYLAATLPAPTTTGLTICGWWQTRVDLDANSTYYRTSGSGGSPTIHSVATYSSGDGLVVNTTSGTLDTEPVTAVDEWVRIAVVDVGTGQTLYMGLPDQETIVVSGVVGTGTPGHFCVGGRSISDATEPFNGNAAHVRIFADALTQAEVEAEWASATPVLTAWADYPFTADIQDTSGNTRHLTAVAGTPAFEAGPDLGGGEPEEPGPTDPPRVLVSDTAVRLTSEVDTGPVGRRLRIRNTSATVANTVALGGSESVTAVDGFHLAAGAQLDLPLGAGEEIWAVRGGDADVAVHVLLLGD